MKTFVIGSGATTRFGCRAIEEVANSVIHLARQRAFLITDSGVVAAGIADRVVCILRDAGIESGVFAGVHPNPNTETLDRGAQAIRAFGDAAIIALGGGSVLDAAKGIALMAVNEGVARDFDYRNQPKHPGLPIIAVPTTSGTGAETNGFGVIDDLEAERKFYVGHSSVVPVSVILDPELTYGLPPGPTAATGMDTLAHALESLSSRRNNPYAEGLCLQVVRIVSRFLPMAVANGHHEEARSQMLLAAHMAALAFSTTGLGLAHAVAHALSARAGIAHGVALAALLPHVVAFNLPVCTETYSRTAWFLGVSDGQRDDRGNAEEVVAAVRDLARTLGMPGSLRDLGCPESLLPIIARDALADEVIGNTPRLPDIEELQALLYSAL